MFVEKVQKTIESKVLFIVFFIILTFNATVGAGEIANIQEVRVSYSPLKTRLVFLLNQKVDFKEDYQEENHTLSLFFSKTSLSLKQNLPKIQATSLLLKDIQIIKDSDEQNLKINISSKKNIKYKIFWLSAPNRLVVDLFNDDDNTAKGKSDAKEKIDSELNKDISNGISYEKMIKYLGDKKTEVFILKVAKNSSYRLKGVLSNGEIRGLATVSVMTAENNAIAGINGSYFNTDGQILGLMVEEKEIISTDDYVRTAIGFWENGKALIEQPYYQGFALLSDKKKVSINAVNRERSEDMLVLYNAYYGKSTQTNTFGLDYVVEDGLVKEIKDGNAVIPRKNGFVFSVHGNAKERFSDVQVGDPISLEQGLGDEFKNAESVISAGPCLVRNKKLFVTSVAEEFPPDIAFGRAPRTAIGITNDGAVLLVVVDGRRSDSVGMTLQELANLMLELGAVHAMNFDGGGSSAMVVQGQVVNRPSDGRERKVGNAIVVVKA